MLISKSYEEMEEYIRDSKERKAFMEELKRLGKDSAFLNLYDREEYEKALQDEMMDKARNEGLSQGIEQGIEKGIEKGIEQKAKEAAISFYQNEVSKELICTSLKITPEQLEEYLKK